METEEHILVELDGKTWIAAVVKLIVADGPILCDEISDESLHG